MPLSPVFVEYEDRLFGAAKPIAIPIYGIGRSPIPVWNLPVVVMCGRYANFLPAEAIAKIFGTVNTLPNITPIWNMAPTRNTARPHFNTSRWRSPGFGRSGQSTHPSSGRTGCSSLARVDGDPASLPRPAPEDVLRTWQVGKAVGNVENDGVELIEPYAPAEPTLLQRQRYRNLRASRVPSHPEVPEMRDDEIAIEQVAKELWQKIIQCGYTVCHDTVNNRPWFTCGSNLDCS
jgi:hypothetical protein